MTLGGPMKRILQIALLITATSIGNGTAIAEDAAAPPRLELSGFGTLGAVTTDNKDVWFTRYGVNFPGNKDPDFSPDTLLGLQASLRLTPSNDITVQVVAREDGGESEDPRVTLAFLRQTLAPGLSLRLGRVRVPFFMLSDSLYVNYANMWVRPPVEVYGLNPFNDLDGIDLLYHTRIGELDAEIHPYYGSGEIPFPEGKARLKETAGVNVMLTQGDYSLHLGHGEARFALERGDARFRALAAGLRAIRQQDVIDDLSGTDGRTSFNSIGLQWDDGTWQLVGEYARRRANRYVVSAHGWYLSLGRRFGNVMPYVTFARQTLDRPIAEANIPPGRLARAWDLFQTSRNNAQHSLTLGTRWDLASHAALKAEASHIRPDRNSWGSFFPSHPGVPTQIGGKTMTTFSLSLDLSF